MRILVIGSGGREHALVRSFAASSQVEAVFCAPGNPGMVGEKIILMPNLGTAHSELIDFARKEQISWTFVGPEAPLAAGIVDDFTAAGLRIFGPTQAAARIESSKSFAKEIMVSAGIPTAAHATFTDLEAAQTYVAKRGAPIVIKADGLAAGKGVVVAKTLQEAQAALQDILGSDANGGGRFGQAGARVVIEDFLEGEEFSLLALVRGKEVFPLPIAQDHKRAYDGDDGPNTGGMGAYSPVPQISGELVQTAIKTVLLPAAEAMIAAGCPFTGVLYAGLIATDEGPKVIEFNARFGDPETQVVLPRLTCDLAVQVDNLLAGRDVKITWDENLVALGVVVAANGYPGDYEKGARVPSFDAGVEVFYAGVSGVHGGELSADGGRIYLVKSSGKSLVQARENVYQALAQVPTEGTFYRSDIGVRALRASGEIK